MRPGPDETARRARASARATLPGEIIAANSPKPSLYDQLTPLERFQRMSALCVAQWEAAGRVIERIPRSEWPGEVFRIGRE